MYFMTCNYLFYMEKTVLVSISTFSSAAIHIIATYFLIKINGVIGAAQAGVISTSVLVSMTWYLSNRTYKMPWSLRYWSIDILLSDLEKEIYDEIYCIEIRFNYYINF